MQTLMQDISFKSMTFTSVILDEGMKKLNRPNLTLEQLNFVFFQSFFQNQSFLI